MVRAHIYSSCLEIILLSINVLTGDQTAHAHPCVCSTLGCCTDKVSFKAKGNILDNADFISKIRYVYVL